MILNSGLYVLAIVGFLSNSVLCEEAASTTLCNEPSEKCYDMAVYNELMKVIEIIKSQRAKSDPRHPRQEDEDENLAGILDADIPSIVPQFFNVVGQVLSFNRTAVAEGALEIIPPGLGNRLASVLGRWVQSSVLGAPLDVPTTTHSPPPKKRRRKTTTTTSPTTEATTNSSTSPEPTSSTEPITEKVSPTPEVLFKAASLGEHPVYASAYAPNYVPTTDYPVYASGFLHVLHGIPITTTAPPTTTPTTEPSTSTDPNSYNVDLPFDYVEPTTTIDAELKSPFFTGPNNGTGSQEEYEYEEGEGTEEGNTVTPGQSRSDSETTTILPPASQTSSNSSSLLPSLASPTPTTPTPKNGTTSAPTTPGGKRKGQGPTFDFSQYRLLKDIIFLLQSWY